MKIQSFPIPEGTYHYFGETRASYDFFVEALGEPHFYEDDETRTAGGHEAYWAWEEDGVIVYFCYALAYKAGGYGANSKDIDATRLEQLVSKLIDSSVFSKVDPYPLF